MYSISTYFTRTFSSLAVRNYRIYTVGQTITQCGSWVQVIALSWLILQMTNSGAALGIVLAAQSLPSLLLGPIIGVYIDRLPHRKLIMANQLFGMLCTSVFALLVATHHITLPLIYMFAALGGLVIAIDNPARQTFVYEMVGEERLKNAITLNSLITNVARIVGPAVSAVIIAWFSLDLCFFVNALSFLGAFIGMASLRSSELIRVKHAPKQHGQIRGEVAYVNHHATVRMILFSMFLIGMFSYEFAVTLPLLAKYTFHGNANAFALLAAAMGAGSIVGGLASAGRKNANVITLGHMALIFGAAMCGVAIAPTLAIAVILIAISGASLMILSVGMNAMLLLHTAPDMRGRMSSLWTMIFIGTTPIGGPLIGWISQQTNPQMGFVIGGVAAFAAAATISGHGLLHIRRGMRLQTVPIENSASDHNTVY